MIESIFQKESMLICQINQKNVCCFYWYFLDKNFSYRPYLCDGCCSIMQKYNKFKNVAIVHVKKSAQNLFSVYE